MSCKDKTALVTGAGGGLGRAIAEAFLIEGGNVVVCDINTDLIKDFKEKVSAAYPKCTLVIECNITKDEALDDLFQQAEKTFSKIDYVVNSAGVMDVFDPVGDLDQKMWDRVISINLTAPVMITKRAVNHMLKHDIKGSIVNIASIAAFRGFSSGCAYTISKHGVLGLTKNTAAFYGPKGIRCNVIQAGGMATNISNHFQKTPPNVDAIAVMQKYYMADGFKMVEVEKVANLVLYLCSDAGSILNGSAVTADGGVTTY